MSQSPRIVEYHQQFDPSQRGAPLPRANPPDMGGPARLQGQALGAIGRALEEEQERVKKRDEEEARAWSATALSEARLKWTTALIERQAEAEPGAPGFTSKVTGDFAKYAEEVVGKAKTPTAKRYLTERMAALHAELGEKAMTFEAQARVDWRSDQFTGAITNTQKLMNQDPSQYPAALAERLAEIDGANIPPIKKSALREKAITDISGAAVWTQIQRSPTGFLQSIGFLDKPTYTAGVGAGMLEQGNIDLSKRPVVKNADGSISTVRSIGVNIDGKEVLIPTVVGGKVVSDDQAIAHYKKTGEHLGVFESPKASEEYAQRLHVQQEQMYKGGKTFKSSGDLNGRTGNAAFDALPFKERTAMFESAIRLKVQMDTDTERTANQQRATLAAGGMQDAWKLIMVDKKPKEAMAQIERIRPMISGPEYHSLLTGWKTQFKPEGTPGQKTDPGAYRDLMSLVIAGKDDDAAQKALTYHKSGLLSNEHLGGFVRNDRRQGPKTEYDLSRALIAKSLEPGAMVPDPVGRARQAQAVDAFDRWVKTNPKADDAAVRARGNEILDQYRFINLSDTVLALPMPRSGAIRRMPQDKTGMQQDLLRAQQAAAKKYAAKQFTDAEYQEEMAILNRWRKTMEQ